MAKKKIERDRCCFRVKVELGSWSFPTLLILNLDRFFRVATVRTWSLFLNTRTESKWKYWNRPKIENRNGASEKNFYLYTFTQNHFLNKCLMRLHEGTSHQVKDEPSDDSAFSNEASTWDPSKVSHFDNDTSYSCDKSGGRRGHEYTASQVESRIVIYTQNYELTLPSNFKCSSGNRYALEIRPGRRQL
ncbi:unnamed protein product [Nesidiocoris tenuis]|uniref:Uncharacterized protein n=1 Tax=Nesidiocoris tenuis TaxID=355587 RepID=A0A6H5GVT3_9HEMI|nr:unnamed protein product [Nesidiocoris tenuis]